MQYRLFTLLAVVTIACPVFALMGYGLCGALVVALPLAAGLYEVVRPWK
jgi:hypothetical protein